MSPGTNSSVSHDLAATPPTTCPTDGVVQMPSSGKNSKIHIIITFYSLNPEQEDILCRAVIQLNIGRCAVT